MIISFEGLDKSGKASALKFTRDFLESKGLKVFQSSFPQYQSAVGKQIWDYLHGQLDLEPKEFEQLQATDKRNAQEFLRMFKLGKLPWQVVLLDRYVDSQIAYGSVACDDMEYVKELTKDFIKPDYTFYMDVKPETSSARRGKHGDNDKYEENIAFLTKVKEAYNKLFINPTLEEKMMDSNHRTVIRIDANQSIEDVNYYLENSLKLILKVNGWDDKE